MGEFANLYTDGACRGNGNNKSISGAGAVLYDQDGNVIKEIRKFLGGDLTNNIAEYLAIKLAHAWNLKYGTNGASNSLSYWNDLTTGTANTITGGTLKASYSGRGANGDVIEVTASLSTTSTLDWQIGDTDATTDNAAVGNDVIMVVESSVAGTSGDAITLASLSVTATDGTATDDLLQALSTTLRTVVDAATDTTNTIYPVEDRTDSRHPEASAEGTLVTAAITAVNQSRVHWFN